MALRERMRAEARARSEHTSDRGRSVEPAVEATRVGRRRTDSTVHRRLVSETPDVPSAPPTSVPTEPSGRDSGYRPGAAPRRRLGASLGQPRSVDHGRWWRWIGALWGVLCTVIAAVVRSLERLATACREYASVAQRTAQAAWGRVAAGRDRSREAGGGGGDQGDPAAPARTVREGILQELAAMSEGRFMVSQREAELWGSAGAAAAAAQVRATRGDSTTAAARRCARQARAFLEANAGLLDVAGEPTADAYDILVDAWIVARCEPELSPWRTCPAMGRGADPRVAGTLRSGLERTGYARGATWERSRATARALGVNDPADAQHAIPIFVWELAEGILAAGIQTVWDQCAAALLTLTALGARRKGAATNLLVGQVRLVGECAVEVSPRQRPKQQRVRAGGRPRRQRRPVIIYHWMIRDYVAPWIRGQTKRRSAASARLFPSITREAPRGAAAELGVRAGGMWLHPGRSWSARQLQYACAKFVRECNGRSVQGFRSGNNIELRRRRDVVSDVTRRTLHERSVKELIQSEIAYDEVFAEDFAEATRLLGSLRIERSVEGLLTVTATNATSGEDQRQWEPLAHPLAIRSDPKSAVAGGGDGPSPDGGSVASGSGQTTSSSSDDDSGDDDSSAAESSTGDLVVGDGGPETRYLTCQRCSAAMGAEDYGFVCDEEGCTWGVCPSCHPGGARAPLRCPRHQTRQPAYLTAR